MGNNFLFRGNMGNLIAFCFLQIERNKRQEVQLTLSKLPEVKAYYRLTGEYNGMIEIEVEDSESVYQLFNKHIDNLDGIQETYTQVVLKKFSMK